MAHWERSSCYYDLLDVDGFVTVEIASVSLDKGPDGKHRGWLVQRDPTYKFDNIEEGKLKLEAIAALEGLI